MLPFPQFMTSLSSLVTELDAGPIKYACYPIHTSFECVDANDGNSCLNTAMWYHFHVVLNAYAPIAMLVQHLC